MSNGGDTSYPVRARIVWRDGVPFTEYVPLVTKDNMTDLHWLAMSMPYEGIKRKELLGEDEDGNKIWSEDETEFINDFEREMHGRRMIEVIAMKKVMLAARGDKEMIKYVEDRSLGKPTQTQQNLQLTGSLQDLFAELRRLDEEDPLLPPPDFTGRLIETNVSESYEILEGEVEEIISREAILEDPMAGF